MKLAKKTLLPLLFVLSTVVTSSAQKVINNPVFGSANDAAIKIERIELTESTTALFFKVTFPSTGWLTIDSGCYIQPSSGGMKYKSIGSKGLEVGFNKKWMMPDSGVRHFVLVYPKLDASITKFNFIESETSKWKIFSIGFTSKISILPEELMGNWITKDATSKWLLGVYDSVVIYNNKLWHYGKVTNQNKTWAVNLIDGTISATIYLRTDVEGNCFVSSSTTKEILCSHFMINIDNHKTTPEKAVFPTPFFKNGYAKLRGFVDGYKPNVTKYADVNSIVAGTHVESLQMADDGSFEVRIPICHPGIYPVRIPILYSGQYHVENVYLEPDQETVCYFSMFNNPLKPSTEKYLKINTLYMGNNAGINNELYQFLKKPEYYIEQVASTDSSDEYQINTFYKNVLKAKRTNEEWVLTHLSTDAISEKTAKIIHTQNMNVFSKQLLSFNANREYKYKTDNHITDYSKDYLTPIPLSSQCMDALKTTLKDTFNLIGKESAAFLRSLENLSEAKKPSYSLLSIMAQMKREGVKFSKDDDALYNWFIAIHSQNKDAVDSFDYYQALTIKFKSKYSNHIDDISTRLQNQTPQEYLKSYLDLPDFLIDIMTLYDAINRFNYPMATPLDRSDVKELKKKFRNPVFSDYLETVNKQIGNTLTENAGSVIKSNRDIDPDNLLESLTKPYRGRVILLDFWETWCIPCKMGMQQMASLKEELKDSSIAFVCLASTSSPDDIWNTLAKTIRGDHYRLNGIQYSAFYNKFNLRSIPRYMLIDKAGRIVNNDLGHKTNEQLRVLLLNLKNK